MLILQFGRYNLKRKVAGLPPVTRAWFDARKEQLTSAAGAGAKRVWVDPLTKKRFGSKNTYEAHVQSKRYQTLVKQSGSPAPEPQVYFSNQQATGQCHFFWSCACLLDCPYLELRLTLVSADRC